MYIIVLNIVEYIIICTLTFPHECLTVNGFTAIVFRLECALFRVSHTWLKLEAVQVIHDTQSTRDVQDCQQRLSSTFDLLLIFLCSLIQTLTLTPPPNNALLAILDMYTEYSTMLNIWQSRVEIKYYSIAFSTALPRSKRCSAELPLKAHAFEAL